MNSATNILRRWRAMDAALADILEGLRIKPFAKRWHVTTKTIRRDLDAFQELGQKVVRELGDDGKHQWTYAEGVEYLFFSNWRGRKRGT